MLLIKQFCYFFILSIKINVIKSTNNGYFSVCDMMEESSSWKRNSGYQLQSWIRSLIPIPTKGGEKNTVGFNFDDNSLDAFDLSSSNGLTWRMFGQKLFDGWLYGYTNSKRDFLPNVTLFIYPDFKTALLGSFKDNDEDMIEGVETKITHYRCSNGVMELKYQKPKENSTLYRPHTATMNQVSRTPLIRDPLDKKNVYIAPSVAYPEMGDEDSLYAKRNIPKYSLITYYNGYLFNSDIQPTNYSSYEAFVKNNAQFNETFSMNLPDECSNIRNYIATLGHKANHHFSRANARISAAKHPVYGEILCLKAIQYIQRGEEILINYNYDLKEEDVPEWYINLYEKQKSKTVSDNIQSSAQI